MVSATSAALGEDGSASGDSLASVQVKKLDGELQIVWGEVYAPAPPDTQRDFMTAEQIREMAYKFMAKSNMTAIDLAHDSVEGKGVIVESFIARKDDPDFIADAWVIGVHVPDTVTWAAIKKGEINGFSLEAWGVRRPAKVMVDIPETLSGETTEAEGHIHKFSVAFDTEGKFLGGTTFPCPRDGHVHRILAGTVTENANGHSHRFSFVEGIGELTYAPA